MKPTIQKLVLACLIGAGASLPLFTGCASRHPHERQTDQFLDNKVTADRVQEALRNNATYQFPHVLASAANGTVTLSGYVENESQRQQAAALAMSVDRVKNIQNHIQIEQSSQSSANNDGTYSH